MKKIKNLLLVILSLVLVMACSGKNTPLEETIHVSIGPLKGPTAIGLADFKRSVIDRDESDDSSYSLEIFPLAEELVGKLNSGDLDLAVIPSNLAASLYNKTGGKLKVLATNNLGVVHLLENGNNIKGLKDLNGKTVYTIGKGTTPDASLNYFKDYYGLSFNIEYRSEASEVASLLGTEEDIIAFLPEPFVSVIEKKNGNIRRLMDMNEKWIEMNDSPIITSVIVGRTEFIEGNPGLVKDLLAQIKESIESDRLEDVLEVSEELGIIPKGLDPSVITRCRLHYLDGDELKTTLNAYLTILEDFNPKLIGGRLPDENFYYEAEVK